MLFSLDITLHKLVKSHDVTRQQTHMVRLPQSLPIFRDM